MAAKGLPRSQRTPSVQPIDYTSTPYIDSEGDLAYIAPDGTAWKERVPDAETAESLGVADQENIPEGWPSSETEPGA